MRIFAARDDLAGRKERTALQPGGPQETIVYPTDERYRLKTVLPAVLRFVAMRLPIFALAAISLWAQDVQVHTRYGAVAGSESEELRVFKGIPYATPPTDGLRWKRPLPPKAWTGIRQATEYAASCIQPARVRPQSEDCLYLNVWSLKAAHNAPVMVWIHGGGYLTGSGSLPYYDGGALARLGAVVVTINYRLGVFGFLATPQLSRESREHVSGNYGLLDQIAALQWVRENIAGFGGDPRNVTIFGESAGAGSVSCLLFSPLAQGLFSRAIAESGALDDQLKDLRNSRGGIESAEHQGVEVSRQLGCSGANTLDCMREMNDRLLEKMLRPAMSCLECTQRDTFGPVVDGYAIPGQPYELLRSGKLNAAAVLTGSNRGEGTIVIGARPVPDVAGYHAWLNTRFKDQAEKVLGAYPAASDDAVRSALRDVYTDSWYLCPSRTLAAAENIAYLYQFTRIRPGMEVRTAHGSEIPYVFDTLKTAGGRVEEIDRSLAGLMSAAWYRFAAKGDPNGDGLPEWPRYDRKSEVNLEFGETVQVNRRLHASQCDMWRFAGHTSGIPGGTF
jgi:para-nitrobenzyl esterase